MAPTRTALVPAALLAALSASVLAATPSSAATAPTAAGATSTALPSVPTVARAAVAVPAPTAADRRIAAKLTGRATARTFGPHFSGTVIDVLSNRVVWSRKGSLGRLPASTTKLVTATNALNLYGPDHRFTTTVKRGQSYSSVILVGSGDPSLSGADLSVLATSTAAEVKAHGVTSVSLYADDHIFSRPTLAAGWKPSYVPADVRWVRALVVDGHHVRDTSLDAASVFAAKLKARGVTVIHIGRATAKPAAPLLAQVQGDRLDAMVTQMLQVSDNDHAEALHRLVARKAGYAASWTGARLAQRAVLARDGVQLTAGAMHDGSGLSRSDRMTTTQLAKVVDNFLEGGQADLAVLRSGALPVAGRTGTLKHRFVTKQSQCAVGRVVAKTGTLKDAVTLAGYTKGADGRIKAFAFIVNGKSATTALKRQVDMLAATVTGCY